MLKIRYVLASNSVIITPAWLLPSRRNLIELGSNDGGFEL